MFAFFRRPPPWQPPEELPDYLHGLARALSPEIRLIRVLKHRDQWSEVLGVDSRKKPVVVTHVDNWDQCSPEHRLRLGRQLEALQKFHHPHVLPMLNYRLEETYCCWSSPWVEGSRLSTALEDGTVPQERILVWLRQLVSVFEAAHQRALIHPKFHPGAVWLTGGNLLVGDFPPREEPLWHQGSAMWHQGSASALSQADYLAPEQIQGNPMGPSTNYFQLGVLACHCLTGATPFGTNDVLQTIVKTMTEPAPDFPDLSECLSTLIRQLLEKDPHRRLHEPFQILRLLDTPQGISPTPTSPEMVQVLQQLQNDGEAVVHRQVFSLDPVVAREKLRKFHFGEPQGPWLALVAAGLALGCQQLDLSWRKGTLQLHYVGCELTRTDLEGLWGYAFSRQRRGLSHLALALASLWEKPQQGRLWIASGGQEMLWRSWEDHSFRSQATVGLTIRLEKSPPPPAWGELKSRLGYAPLAIVWDGHKHLPVRPNQPVLRPGYELSVELLEADELVAVIDGVGYPLACRPNQVGRVVFWGPLPLDASHSRPVADDRLGGLLQQLDGRLRDCLWEFASHPKSLAPEAERLYRLALRDWQEQARQEELECFYGRYLELVAAAPGELAWEAWRYFRKHASPPRSFWKLCLRQPFWRRLEATWEMTQRVASEALEPGQRADWLGKVWLEWGSVRPHVAEISGLLPDIPQSLDEPLARQLARGFALEVDPELRRQWLALLPAHCPASRQELKKWME